MPLEHYGVPGRVVFTPGHTAGSISVVLDSGEAIVGDLLRGGYLGGAIFAGRPGFPYVADNLDENRESITRSLALNPLVVFTGHGGPLAPVRISRWLAQTM